MESKVMADYSKGRPLKKLLTFSIKEKDRKRCVHVGFRLAYRQSARKEDYIRDQVEFKQLIKV